MPEDRIPNLFAHIEALARRQPKKAALVGCDEEGGTTLEITYGELPTQLSAAAAYIASLGLRKGDKLALAFKNSPELLVLSWAAWASGIETVPLDTKRDTEELCDYKITINNAKALLIQKGALKTPRVRVPVVEFAALPIRPRRAAPHWESGLDHPALILFTSGTTSHPKGAKLSLRNLIVNADGIREWLHITEDDRFLVQLPLHHINSTTFCLSILLAGATSVIPPQYSNSRFWKQAATTKATITSIVQSILADQLEKTEEFAAHKADIALNRIQIGSAPVVAHTVHEFITRFGIKVYQGYGQTETALRVTGVPMDLPQELYEKLVEENSIGTPMRWADVQVSGRKGALLGEREEGELVVKGPAVMEGYVGGEKAFNESGYFLTGDIGYFKIIEGVRYFYLVGRSREIIIKGGINISPVAVENGLKKADTAIAQAYCIGYSDDRYGEEVAAAIVWRDGVDEGASLRKLKTNLLLGSSSLSVYETPQYLASIGGEELPLTSTGKVQRTVLRRSLPLARFSPIRELMLAYRYLFHVLSPHSPFVQKSHELYNHCWQPLIVPLKQYTSDIAKQTVLMAIDEGGAIAGQIAFVRTNLSAKELLKTTYAELLSPHVASKDGKAIVCVSICSADYKPRAIPSVSKIPDERAVREYLDSGADGVIRFHEKPKGGLAEGARIAGLIPSGRPEDKSACGYNVLMRYPPLSKAVEISDDAPVSVQLIEAAMLLARDLGLKDVYAYSRPGGLASYVAKQEK